MAISIPITTHTPPSVTSLIRKYRKLHKIARVLDCGAVDDLYDAAADLRFDIAHAPARTAQEVAAKALFFLRDHIEVGPCDPLADAMRAGIRADIQRLGGAA